jgi:hypothetical protein
MPRRSRYIGICVLIVAASAGYLVLSTPHHRNHQPVKLATPEVTLKSSLRGNLFFYSDADNGSCLMYRVKGALTMESVGGEQIASGGLPLVSCGQAHSKSKPGNILTISGEGTIFAFTEDGTYMQWTGRFIYVVDRTQPNNYAF